MPGFVDTHHHQFETAIRSFLADGLLFNDGQPHGAINYFQYILGTFAPVYRPRDVYISELFGSLSQLDAGVTTVHDISQIHYTPQHSDAAIKGSADSGRRIVFGYFEGARPTAGSPRASYPQDARRIKRQYFSSSDQLMTMFMGGEIYLRRRRRTGLAARARARHSRSRPTSSAASACSRSSTPSPPAARRQFGPDNLFIHMTGMSDVGWQAVKDAGAGVSLAVPIEMNMRHGTPPILKTLAMGIQPSLSVDVEVTLTADMFTQMRSAMALQRMFVNARRRSASPMRPASRPELLTTRDVLRFATIEGARDLKLDHKIGSLTPGQGGRHHHPRRRGDQRRTAQRRAGRRRVADGAHQRRDRDRRGQGAQVERQAARRQPRAGCAASWRTRATILFSAAGVPQDLFRPN